MAFTICIIVFFESVMTEKKEVLIENKYGKIELEGGIVTITWKITNLDLNAACQAVKIRLELTHNQSYPVLTRMKSLKDSTKEARDYLASAEGCNGMLANAIYVESVLENMIATFFVFLNKPQCPTRIFNNEAKARVWLRKYVNKK